MASRYIEEELCQDCQHAVFTLTERFSECSIDKEHHLDFHWKEIAPCPYHTEYDGCLDPDDEVEQ